MDARKFLKLNDIESFRISFHLSNYVWDVVLSGLIFLKEQLESNLSEQLIAFQPILPKGLEDMEKRIRSSFIGIVRVH